MSRYKSTFRVNDKVTKNRKLKITEYPKIDFKDTDVIHITRFDENYMSLAHRYYNDQSLWWIIARANDEFKGTINFEPGTNLIIPMEIDEILDRLDILNKQFERPD
tara:strand:- start:2642 stop:2959 length:318 start_codon:yes stop_codon:yes gene_type:complete